MRVLGALAMAAALVLAGLPTAAAEEPQAYYWRWSDGSHAPARTFSERDTDDRLPRLVVTARPASPSRRVELQVRMGRGWRTEDAATTGPDGVARLQIDPFCSDGGWCRQAFAYRLVAGGRTADLTVTFRP